MELVSELWGYMQDFTAPDAFAVIFVDIALCVCYCFGCAFPTEKFDIFKARLPTNAGPQDTGLSLSF